VDKTARRGRLDLTEGPVLKGLIMFALPIIAGNLFNQLYNVVDSIVVGNYVGTDALAAVGASFPVMMLFNALFMGVAMGAQIVIAQVFGAKDFPLLKTVVHTSISLAFIIGAFITVVGTPLVRPMLTLLKVPANILDSAAAYLTIVFLGTLGNVFYMLVSGAMRGMGDSRWPLIALIISTITNIVLDLVFVIVFNLGAAGVALATAIAHFLSGFVLIWRIQTGDYPVKIIWKQLLKPDKEATKRIIQLGLPSTIQSVAMSCGSLVTQSFSNMFGSNYIAAHTITMKVDGFAMMPMMGIGQACTSFAGQNMGAGKQDRAKKGILVGVLSAVTIAVVMGFTLYFVSPYLMMAFGAEGNVLMMGVSGVRFLAFCYMFMGIDHTIAGSMRGAGATVVPSIGAMTSSFLRIPLIYFVAIVPFKETVANLIATLPENLVTLTNEYMATGLYKTFEAAQQAAAGSIASLDHFMSMFYCMGISMLYGAVFMFIYFKFGKWHQKADKIVRRVPAPAPKTDEE